MYNQDMTNAINKGNEKMKTTTFNPNHAIALVPGKGIVQVLIVKGNQAVVTSSLGGCRKVHTSSLRSIVSKQGTNNQITNGVQI
jgi:hypothetical protein